MSMRHLYSQAALLPQHLNHFSQRNIPKIIQVSFLSVGCIKPAPNFKTIKIQITTICLPYACANMCWKQILVFTNFTFVRVFSRPEYDWYYSLLQVIKWKQPNWHKQCFMVSFLDEFQSYSFPLEMLSLHCLPQSVIPKGIQFPIKEYKDFTDWFPLMYTYRDFIDVHIMPYLSAVV